jgi:hypothetical protein
MYKQRWAPSSTRSSLATMIPMTVKWTMTVSFERLLQGVMTFRSHLTGPAIALVVLLAHVPAQLEIPTFLWLMAFHSKYLPLLFETMVSSGRAFRFGVFLRTFAIRKSLQSFPLYRHSLMLRRTGSPVS